VVGGKRMKLLISITLTFFLFSDGYALPCQDYTCDSLAVRAILDSNGLDTVAVESVSAVSMDAPINSSASNRRFTWAKKG